MKRSIAALIIGLMTAFSAEGAETLRWKFNAGDAVDCVVTRRREAKLDLNGNELEITFGTISDLHWKVDSVADGKAHLTATIERLQLEVKSPIEEFVWDSTGDEPQASSLWEEVRDRILKLLKSPIKITIDPLGKIDEIAFTEEVKEALSQPTANPQVERFLSGVLDEKGIKNIIGQAFLPLPDAAPAEGTNWEVTEEVDRPPFGKQIVVRKMTYAGKDEGSGDVDTVTLGSKLDFKTAEGEGAEGFSLTMSEQDGQGAAQFDNETGRLKQMNFVQKVKMDIAMNGTDIIQNITETMSVGEGKSPPSEPQSTPAADEEKKDDENKEEAETK